MIGYVLAKRYARAAIDLARKAEVVDEVGRDLQFLAEQFAASDQLVNVFSDPTVPHKGKEGVLEALLEKGKVAELTVAFTRLLLEKNRLLGIRSISTAYRDLSDDLYNRVRARVVTAAPLEEKERERVRLALAELTGKEVLVDEEVDEELLGGVVAYVGSMVYDGSLRNQLDRIREKLNG